MKYIFFLLSIVATAQTRVAVSQVPWNQSDDSWYRQCIFNADGSYANAYAFIANASHATVSTSKNPPTYLRMSQIRGYGMAVSSDGTTLVVKNWDTSWTVTIQNPTVSGILELRFATWTPNFNIVDPNLPPVQDSTVAANELAMYTNALKLSTGGWGITINGGYPQPPQASATFTNGVFAMIPSTMIIHNACELWNTGMFTNIPPNP
jgi:hypothetical protein